MSHVKLQPLISVLFLQAYEEGFSGASSGVSIDKCFDPNQLQQQAQKSSTRRLLQFPQQDKGGFLDYLAESILFMVKENADMLKREGGGKLDVLCHVFYPLFSILR